MLSTFWKNLLLFTLGAAVCVIGYLFLLGVPFLSPTSPTAGVVPAIVVALAAFWLNARFLRADGLSLTAIGCELSRYRAVQFGYGFLGGGLLTGAWVGIVAVATGAHWHLNPAFRATALVGACVFALFNNAGEELIYRGYAFVRIADHFHPAVAVVATSMVFAILHIQAGIPWLNVIAGVLTSGLIFAVLFARWRSLPLALGFHVATNVFQESSGLRPSAASLMAPAYPPTPGPAAMSMALAGVAALNLAAAVVLTLPWRRNSVSSTSTGSGW